MALTIHAQIPDPLELIGLYHSVGWSAYTNDPERLVRAVNTSHTVMCARIVNEDTGTGRAAGAAAAGPGAAPGALVGLARTISDGETVAYVQDILVAPDHRREGIGGALLDSILEKYADVRQLVLLTDDEPGQRAFYESRGLTEAHDMAPHPTRAFVRFA